MPTKCAGWTWHDIRAGMARRAPSSSGQEVEPMRLQAGKIRRAIYQFIDA